MRRTKIVATLGPATSSDDAIEKLILAGVNVVRLNFSHGEPAQHRALSQRVRTMSERYDCSVAILGDLQGPKIRIGRFQKSSIELEPGASFILDADLALDAGTQERVGLTYKTLPEDCQARDILLLDDGCLSVRVERVEGARIHTRVVVGGVLSNSKGINRQGGGLSAPALTEKDRADIELAAELGVDYLAVSFPRKAADILHARQLLRDAGGHGFVVAKIERADLVADNAELTKLVRASDGIMVARGDLGVEIGDAELIGMQKHLITLARELNKPVITATQMMESMIHSAQPTRAEVFDVANAVLDGTDAVMLSAETATGDRPQMVVEAMSRICQGAEKQSTIQVSSHRMDWSFNHADETIAMAAMYAANHMSGVKAIVCLTESGSTPLWMSRISSGLPIFVLTRHEQTRRRCALYRGVEALTFDLTQLPQTEINRLALNALIEQKWLQPGDTVILTRGERMGVEAGTNTLKILTA